MLNHSFVIKDANQNQLNGETHRQSLGESQTETFHAPFPVESGHATFPAHRCIYQPGGSPRHWVSTVFVGVSLYTRD